ncbi:hypothetical protein R1sor_008465 [Riccia sorocarpa]|uniref:Uncharacterized protein n=1 Tax=Riccia sorocarpa TaxID=122646 RepID=A0ABD3HWY6_9MARC
MSFLNTEQLETCDSSWPWLDFLSGEEGYEGAVSNSDFLPPNFDPSPYEKEIYIHYVEDIDETSVSCHDYEPEYGTFKKPRLLFREDGPDGSTLSNFVVGEGFLLPTSNQMPRPQFGASIPESDISQWPTTSKIGPQYDNRTENPYPKGTQEMQTSCPDHLLRTTPEVNIAGLGYESASQDSMQNVDIYRLSPRTPDPPVVKNNLTELRKEEKPVRGAVESSAPTTSEEDSSNSSAARKSKILRCQPFAILKPEGVNISDINEFLRSPSSRIRQCSEADYSLSCTAHSRDLSVGRFGKPVLARTRVITETNGTLTIIRTANP